MDILKFSYIICVEIKYCKFYIKTVLFLLLKHIAIAYKIQEKHKTQAKHAYIFKAKIKILDKNLYNKYKQWATTFLRSLNKINAKINKIVLLLKTQKFRLWT